MKGSPKKTYQLIIFTLLSGLYLIYSYEQAALGAGFDCANANTFAEKYVCSQEKLSALDTILNEVYATKRKHLTTAEQELLKQEQVAWLGEREECMENLPSDTWFCMLNTYHNRIIAMGGIEHLLAYYKQRCTEEEWECITAGDLEWKRGNLDNAVHYYSIMCNADRDGDQGNSCYKKAGVLEQLGKLEEARSLYVKTCEARDHNEACAAAERLNPMPGDADDWTGLYRSDTGTLFIKKRSAGLYVFNFDTTWANGHLCGYKSTFTLMNGEPVVPADEYYPECQPKIVKKGDSLSIKDPDRQCQHICGVRASFEETFNKE